MRRSSFELMKSVVVLAILIPAVAPANSHLGYSYATVTPTSVAPGDDITVEFEYTVYVSDGSQTSLWAVIFGGVTGQLPYNSAGVVLVDDLPSTLVNNQSYTVTVSEVVQIPETAEAGQYPINIFSCAASYQPVSNAAWYVTQPSGQPIMITVEAAQQDTTPPVITCPDDITVYVAQGETGAMVEFDVTATDDVSDAEDIVIVCDPASGSTFPLGDTVVNCTATDEAGNSVTDSFTISILGPTELVEDLSVDVFLLNLQNGIENSLDAKLDAALNALDDLNENNDVAAINSLNAFINAVEAQSGNKIPVADANALIAAAQDIIALI